MNKVEKLLEYTSVRPLRGKSKKKKITDIRKRQAAKLAWKRNRAKMVSAIQRAHKSPSGRQLHRTLGRFNKNRSESLVEMLLQLINELATLS